MLKHVLFGGPGGGSKLADLGLLLGRAGTGLFLAFGHGIGKLPPEGTQKFAGALAKMDIPAPTLAAWMALFAEFGGGILLALGLLTRPAALLIVITMAVAALTAHASDPLFLQNSPNGRAKELALLYLMPALMFLFTGAGRYGVDAVLRPKGARRRGSSDRD